MRLQCKENKPWGQIVKRIAASKGLKEMAWEEGSVP
jgi:hypothetical protein